MARGLPEAEHVGLNHIILLAGNFDEALHCFLSDLQIHGLEGLVEDLGHEEVAFSRHLEIACRVRNAVEEGTHCKAAWLNLGLVLADVVCEGHHDRILQLLGQVVRLQLLANVADSSQRRQPHLLVFIACVSTQVCE